MTAIMLAVIMTALGMAGTIGGARALVVSRPLKSEDARKAKLRGFTSCGVGRTHDSRTPAYPAGRFGGLDFLTGFGQRGRTCEAEADAGFPGQKESELAVVRALLRLILSSNVRMPLSRLQ
jgi:hypothetical protein